MTPTRGLRTAVAFGLSLLVLVAFGHTSFGGAVGFGFLLGVLFTSFGDVGASVRLRIGAMSALTLGGPLVVAAGRSLTHPWWLAALAVFVVTLVAGFLSLYGPLVSLVGVLLTIVFGMGSQALSPPLWHRFRTLDLQARHPRHPSGQYSGVALWHHLIPHHNSSSSKILWPCKESCGRYS